MRSNCKNVVILPGDGISHILLSGSFAVCPLWMWVFAGGIGWGCFMLVFQIKLFRVSAGLEKTLKELNLLSLPKKP